MVSKEMLGGYNIMKVSKAFELFAKEAPEAQQAWMEVVQKLDSASKLAIFKLYKYIDSILIFPAE